MGMVINARNVNDAYAKGVALLNNQSFIENTRAGWVKSAPFPVMTTYTHPMERVLFDPLRDANPFFHLFEALWLLAGRNDARWLDNFVHDFSERFAEEDGTLHGSYGFRWRRHFDLEGGGCPGLPDQLNTVVELLRKNPNDRRVVLTMWDPVSDLDADKKDIPCNTHAYFRVLQSKLHMTVCCRSNDIIWGAYGANAVQFSVLQEYLAARLGIGMGTYYQFSNNYHAYLDVLEKVGAPPVLYPYREARALPIVTVPEKFDEVLARFFDHKSGNYANTFFDEVARPLLQANGLWKNRAYDLALEHVANSNCDWKLAAYEWMKRRLARMYATALDESEAAVARRQKNVS